MSYVIKRNGEEAVFDVQKIERAIAKAVAEVPQPENPYAPTPVTIKAAAEKVAAEIEKLGRAANVEEIQDLVERELMSRGWYEVAQHYVRYRYEHELLRKKNTTDERIFSLVEYDNEDVKQENSNKNPEIIPTQRDYIAGEISKDLTRRYLLPEDIMQAHDEGIIHFHDADYFIQHSHNCCLVNLEDMLQNGTVISKTLIEKPHMFSTACNIATQIIAQVASCQYGGQTITMAHLAPFVQSSREKFYHDYYDMKDTMGEEAYQTFIERMVREDIKRGVQTIQYQVVTLMTTNGQAPFITVYLDINEVPEGQTRKDLALVIAEVLKQRYEGVKNEQGVWITPAFPKLIYALDENNTKPGTDYWYLTKLAAKCTAKRMVPDYISRKLMRELKAGDTYPCMGCRSFLTPDHFTDAGVGNVAKAQNYVPGKHKYYGRLTIS